MAQTVCVVVDGRERVRLVAIVDDRNRPRKHVERARIVLASADRKSAQHLAQSIGVSRPTVWRWQQRFAEAGVEGLLKAWATRSGCQPTGSCRKRLDTCSSARSVDRHMRCADILSLIARLRAPPATA
jgi:hypothetical protein